VKVDCGSAETPDSLHALAAALLSNNSVPTKLYCQVKWEAVVRKSTHIVKAKGKGHPNLPWRHSGGLEV